MTPAGSARTTQIKKLIAARSAAEPVCLALAIKLTHLGTMNLRCRMPKVPDYGPTSPQASAQPEVNPTYLMMAAAVMHEQGRLFDPSANNVKSLSPMQRQNIDKEWGLKPGELDDPQVSKHIMPHVMPHIKSYGNK